MESAEKARWWRSPRVVAAIAVAVLVVGAGAFVLTARATDASSFCARCHEMVPYNVAWAAGTHGHQGVDCVECHVNPGIGPRLAHKFVALGEVWAHFFGNTSFPLETPPNVPNRRCEGCHPNVTVNRKNFSHELHASKGSCRDCHPNTGHSVSTQALKDAGIYNPNVTASPFVQKVAVVNGGRANLPGHVNVVCSRCHDLKATGCRPCHTPPHEERGDCVRCHKPGKRWVYSHPGAGSDCTQCHKVPSKHPAAAADKPCTNCHIPGKRWSFSHPGAGATCSDCHTPPANHYPGACGSCHLNPGVSWAFAHPSAGEHNYRSMPCKNCHPNNYTTSYCTCHKGRPPSGD
jgi:nitrate/TMAO reductase-like tetraheme cytochrome c subunit